jgi:hypothetical protein
VLRKPGYAVCLVRRDAEAEAFRQLRYLTVPLAVYPAGAIEAHRAFIARRRATRPSEEYRTPTDEGWDAFLRHRTARRRAPG